MSSEHELAYRRFLTIPSQDVFFKLGASELLDQGRRLAEEAERPLRKTSLEEYLQACHVYLHKPLSLSLLNPIGA